MPDSNLSSIPLRILHVATHTNVRRGGAVQACRMIQWQVARGHHVRLIVNVDEVTKRQQAEDLDSWKERLPQAVEVLQVRMTPALTSRLKLAWEVTRFRPDVVHAHRDTALEAVAWVAKWNRGFVFLGQRGTTKVPPAGVSAIWNSGRVDATICVADAVRDVMLSTTKMPPEKVHTIYGTIDLEEFAPRPRNEDLRAELGYAPTDFVLGSMSAYRKDKGLRMLVEAAALARQAVPHLRLLFLGTKVEYKLKKNVAQHGVAEIVRFAGHQSRVQDWLAAMDCTVMCASAREGLSGVLRESLAAEIPVISTNTDGNVEIVRDRETGLLIPVNDVQALTDAIVYAANHPEEMRAMAVAGRQWVIDHCSQEVHAEKLEALMQRLVKEKRG